MEDKEITYINASDFDTAAEKVDKSLIFDLSTFSAAVSKSDAFM